MPVTDNQRDRLEAEAHTMARCGIGPDEMLGMLRHCVGFAGWAVPDTDLRRIVVEADREIWGAEAATWQDSTVVWTHEYERAGASAQPNDDPWSRYHDATARLAKMAVGARPLTGQAREMLDGGAAVDEVCDFLAVYPPRPDGRCHGRRAASEATAQALTDILEDR